MRIAAGVMAAGALGAAARYAVGLAFQPANPALFPWGTFAANIAGCLLLGTLTGAAARLGIAPFWRETIGTGFIGSFTTFSAFSMETVGLIQADHAGMAAFYLSVSIAGGYAAAWLGIRSGRRAKGAGKP